MLSDHDSARLHIMKRHHSVHCRQIAAVAATRQRARTFATRSSGKQKDRLAAVSPDLLALLDVQTLSDFIHSALPEHKACPLVAGFEIHLRPEEPGPNVLIVHDLF